MRLAVDSSSGMDVIRAFVSILDNFIYGMIAWCYEFIDAIAGMHFEGTEFDAITDRIYAFLSIFMLFKVSFSFINYLINPDSFTDKNKGVQKVVLNIIIMFLMLLVNPWAFKTLYNIQDSLLKENVIEHVIFGTTNTDDGNTIDFQMSTECGNDFAKININYYKGDYVSLLLFRPFYQPYKIAHVKDEYCRTDKDGELHVHNFLKYDIYNAEKRDVYSVSYIILASTFVGVVALLILLGMLLDVALRAVKLLFLQIIAPIPIISYIDPKSGKDGIFKKWLKEVGGTWASLFIRLFGFNFSVFLIQIITTGKIVGIKDNYAGKWYIEVLLIIGVLMFVKKLPEMLSNIFGIKTSGGFNINPLKKISNEALGGKAVLGLGAAGVAAGMSGAANLGHRLLDKNTWAMRNKDGKLTAKSIAGGLARGIGKTGSSAIAGAASGGYRTFNKVSKDGKIAAGIKAGHLESMFAKQQREDLERRGSKLGGRLRADANRWVGRLNEGQRQELLAADQDQFIAQETEKLRTEKLQLSNREAQLGNDKADLSRDKANTTRPFEQYSSILGKIKTEISVDPKVKAAQAHLDHVKATNSADTSRITTAEQELQKIAQQMILNPNSSELQIQYAAAQANLTNVTAQVEQEKQNIEVATKYLNDLKLDTYKKYTTEGNDRYDLIKSYTDQLDELRRENTTLADTKFDYIRSDGSFNDVVMYAVDREKTLVEEKQFATREEQIRVSEEKIAVHKQDLADREREIENYKKSDEYVNAHDQNSKAMADNAARKISGKQPEGWKPSADVNAGGTRGYGGNQWYNNNGGNS